MASSSKQVHRNTMAAFWRFSCCRTLTFVCCICVQIFELLIFQVTYFALSFENLETALRDPTKNKGNFKLNLSSPQRQNWYSPYDCICYI